MKNIGKLLATSLALFIAVPINAQVGIPGVGIQHSTVDPSIAANLNYLTHKYYWNGTTTLPLHASCTRADNQLSTAPNRDGTWSTFAPSTPRVAAGWWNESSSTNLAKQNGDASVSPWATSNMTVSNTLPTPFFPTLQARQVVVIPAGSTTWNVPADWTSASNTIIVISRGGKGANGTINTNSGGGGGPAVFAVVQNAVLTPSSTVNVQIPVATTAQVAWIKDNNGVVLAQSDYGRDASGVTLGAAGLATNSVGTTLVEGWGGRNGRTAIGNDGGGAGGSVGGFTGAPGFSSAGSSGGGGGAGGADGGSDAGAAGGSSGAAGGNNSAGTGAGVGGTPTTAAVAGIAGGGGPGGHSLVGINAAVGSYVNLGFWDPVSQTTINANAGPGSGGGGGGFGGNGASGAYGAGGGGGGSSLTTAGTGANGGDAVIIAVYGSSGASLLTATASNATLSQPITAASATYTQSALLYRQSAGDITGPVYMSIDDFVTSIDISSLLVTGKWPQIAIPAQTLANPKFGLKIANSGDKLGIYWMQVEAKADVSTPIPTGKNTAQRKTDNCVLLIANYPGIITNNEITVLMSVLPRQVSVGGYTAFEMGNSARTEGYFFNAQAQTDGGGVLHNYIGVTYVAGGVTLGGVDPAIEFFRFNEYNMSSFSAKMSTLTAVTALRGDFTSRTFASWPDISLFTAMQVGGQIGTGGFSTYGAIGEIIILNKAWPGSQQAVRSILPAPTP